MIFIQSVLCAKIANSDAVAGSRSGKKFVAVGRKNERPGATLIESLRDLLVDQPN
jgi:hypothetical protein